MILIERARAFLKNDRIIFDALLGVFLTGVGGAANYFARIIALRQLTPDDFADFNTLFSMAQIFSFTMIAFRFYIVRRISDAADDEERASIIFRFIASLMIILFVFGLAISALTPIIATSVNISRPIGVPLMAALGIFLSGILVGGSVLQGLQHVKLFNVITNIQPLIRLAAVFVILWTIGLTLSNAMTTFIFSAILTTLIFIIAITYFLRKNIGALKTVFSPETFDFLVRMIPPLIPLFIINALIVITREVDMILANRFLSPTSAAAFASLSPTLAKPLTFLAASIVFVMHPRLSADLTDHHGNRKMLYQSLGLNLLLGLGVAAGLLIFDDFIITRLFTEEYYSVIPYLPYVLVAIIAFTFTNVFFYYFATYERFWIIYTYGVFLLMYFFALRYTADIIALLERLGFALEEFRYFIYVTMAVQVLIMIWNFVVFLFMRRGQKVSVSV